MVRKIVRPEGVFPVDDTNPPLDEIQPSFKRPDFATVPVVAAAPTEIPGRRLRKGGQPEQRRDPSVKASEDEEVQESDERLFEDNAQALEYLFSTEEKRDDFVDMARRILHVRLGEHMAYFSDDVIHDVVLQILKMSKTGRMKYNFLEEGEAALRKYIVGSIFYRGISIIRKNYPRVTIKDSERKRVTAIPRRAHVEPLRLNKVNNRFVANEYEESVSRDVSLDANDPNSSNREPFYDPRHSVEAAFAVLELLEVLKKNPYILFDRPNEMRRELMFRMFKAYLEGQTYREIAAWAYPDLNPRTRDDVVRKNIARLRERLVAFLEDYDEEGLPLGD